MFQKYLIGYPVLGNSLHSQERDVLHNFQFRRLKYPHIHHHYHSLLREVHIYFVLYSNSKSYHCFCRFHGHCNWLHLHMRLPRTKKKAHLNFVLNFLSICSRFFWPEQLTHTKKEQFAKTLILYNDRNLQSHTNFTKLAKSVFANLSVSLVKDDLIENRGNLITKIGRKASQFSI